MSTKSKALVDFLEIVKKAAYGDSGSDACVGCDSPNLNFRDELSRKEYGISRFCQTCQDGVFGVEDPNELDSD